MRRTMHNMTHLTVKKVLNIIHNHREPTHIDHAAFANSCIPNKFVVNITKYLGRLPFFVSTDIQLIFS